MNKLLINRFTVRPLLFVQYGFIMGLNCDPLTHAILKRSDLRQRFVCILLITIYEQIYHFEFDILFWSDVFNAHFILSKH